MMLVMAMSATLTVLTLTALVIIHAIQIIHRRQTRRAQARTHLQTRDRPREGNK